MPPRPLPIADIHEAVDSAHDAFAALRGARIFLTGGTGFFGRWLLESLLAANHALGLDVQATVLTRNADAFRAAAPHITGDPAITLVEGDISTFVFPSARYTHILHAATDSQVRTTEAELAASIVAGTQHVLHFAREAGAQRLLYVSSGAVYGRGITEVARIPETYPLPLQLAAPSNYDEAKRVSEELCRAADAETGLAVSIARCFAFVGPLLPLDAHFAIGNFIRDALAGTPIHIKGDGTPLRSFLYMSDLAAWLWTLLVHAPAGSIVNVGSDEAVSIAQLAKTVADILRPGLRVQIDGTPDPARPPASYVPDISRAKEHGLRITVPLAEAIRRTAAWNA
jgi:dTDP-glucose 4,6-dehydratase